MSYIGKEPVYGAFEKQNITGDGSNSQFTLNHPVASASSILVSMGGVIQEPETAYTISFVSGEPKITFSFTPTNGTKIFIIYLGRQALTQSAASLTADPTVDSFTGDGSDTTFSLSTTPALPSKTMLVFVNGVFQKYTTNYSVSGTTLTFTSAPANNAVIVAINMNNSSEVVISSVSNNSITNAKLNLSYAPSYFTGDGSSTAFTLTESNHSVNTLLVTENGVLQKPSDDYTVSGTTLTFTTAPVNNVQIGVRYLPFGATS